MIKIFFMILKPIIGFEYKFEFECDKSEVHSAHQVCIMNFSTKEKII